MRHGALEACDLGHYEPATRGNVRDLRTENMSFGGEEAYGARGVKKVRSGIDMIR
jgi:hypothetical protein